jgi:hypothetical protein
MFELFVEEPVASSRHGGVAKHDRLDSVVVFIALAQDHHFVLQ